MKSNNKNPADFITPITVNGLHGRVLQLPANKKSAKREILMVYGHHSSLERMFGILDNIADYGNVVMPDLPGFGGMDSFYKIKEKPTLDNLADYLTTFIKLKYKNKHITIGGMSFGFVVVARMLQKYPKMIKQVDLLISIVGFTSKEDFKFKKRTFVTFRYLSSFCSNSLPAAFAKYIVLRGPVISATYKLFADRNIKMKDANNEERKRRIKFEIKLWQSNDIRTYMDTTITMMTLDITDQKVDVPVLHITAGADQYFDATRVKKNLKKIFNDVTVYKTKLPSHAPTVIGDSENVKGLIPIEVRRKLAKAPKLKR